MENPDIEEIMRENERRLVEVNGGVCQVAGPLKDTDISPIRVEYNIHNRKIGRGRLGIDTDQFLIGHRFRGEGELLFWRPEHYEGVRHVIKYTVPDSFGSDPGDEVLEQSFVRCNLNNKQKKPLILYVTDEKSPAVDTNVFVTEDNRTLNIEGFAVTPDQGAVAAVCGYKYDFVTEPLEVGQKVRVLPLDIQKHADHTLCLQQKESLARFVSAKDEQYPLLTIVRAVQVPREVYDEFKKDYDTQIKQLSESMPRPSVEAEILKRLW
jgi:hypothetical protein